MTTELQPSRLIRIGFTSTLFDADVTVQIAGALAIGVLLFAALFWVSSEDLSRRLDFPRCGGPGAAAGCGAILCRSHIDGGGD
jgi:hypothetical protein